jgi:hypothetical protein
MIIEDLPLINFIPENNRQDGISAFMRIKNGEDYLEVTILSIINQVDEIICVFNDCNDDTENILIRLEKKFSKIKVYKYIPPVYVMNSEKYLETDEHSVNSFSYYSNFSLSKTTKKYCIKVDDDEIFFPNILLKLKNELERNNDRYSIGIKGINLVDYKKKLYINFNNITTGGGDTLFFKYNNNNRFYKTTNFEKFNGPPINRVEDAFYHTKRCKKDRGINNYGLDENLKSRYNEINKNYFNTLKLIPFEEYINRKNFLINPIKLGFKFVNNSIKKYNASCINLLEQSIIVKDKIVPIKQPVLRKVKQSIQRILVKQPIPTKLEKKPIQKILVNKSIQRKLFNKPIQRKLVNKFIQRKLVIKPIKHKLVIKPIQHKLVIKPIQRNLVIKPIQRNLVNKPIQRNLVKKLVQTILVKKPLENNLVKKPIETNSVKKPVESILVKKPVESILVKKPIETNSVKKPVESILVKKPIETNLVKKPIETNSVKKPVESNLVKKPVENNLIKKLIQRNLIKKPLQRNLINKPLQRKLIKKPLQRKLIKKPLQRKLIKKPIKRKIVKKPIKPKLVNKLIQRKN